MFSVLTDFDRARVEQFKQATEDKLRDVRCPEHHLPPRLRFNGTSLRDVGISLRGCCPKVMELANAAVANVAMPNAILPNAVLPKEMPSPSWLAATSSSKAS